MESDRENTKPKPKSVESSSSSELHRLNFERILDGLIYPSSFDYNHDNLNNDTPTTTTTTTTPATTTTPIQLQIESLTKGEIFQQVLTAFNRIYIEESLNTFSSLCKLRSNLICQQEGKGSKTRNFYDEKYYGLVFLDLDHTVVKSQDYKEEKRNVYDYVISGLPIAIAGVFRNNVFQLLKKFKDMNLKVVVFSSGCYLYVKGLVKKINEKEKFVSDEFLSLQNLSLARVPNDEKIINKEELEKICILTKDKSCYLYKHISIFSSNIKRTIIIDDNKTFVVKNIESSILVKDLWDKIGIDNELGMISNNIEDIFKYEDVREPILKRYINIIQMFISMRRGEKKKNYDIKKHKITLEYFKELYYSIFGKTIKIKYYKQYFFDYKEYSTKIKNPGDPNEGKLSTNINELKKEVQDYFKIEDEIFFFNLSKTRIVNSVNSFENGETYFVAEYSEFIQFNMTVKNFIIKTNFNDDDNSANFPVNNIFYKTFEDIIKKFNLDPKTKFFVKKVSENGSNNLTLLTSFEQFENNKMHYAFKLERKSISDDDKEDKDDDKEKRKREDKSNIQSPKRRKTNVNI